jgi:hypothetical protein
MPYELYGKIELTHDQMRARLEGKLETWFLTYSGFGNGQSGTRKTLKRKR